MTHTAPRPVRFVLDGREVEVFVREDETLLETLRDRLGVHTVKDGCSPQGQCGACMALVDGAAKTTCSKTTTKVEGRRVVTLAGLDVATRERLVAAFSGGVQCGFCLPAIALHTVSFTEHHPRPSDEEIHHHFDQNLCRCTGYTRLLEGVKRYAEGVDPQGAVSVSGIGASLPHPDARARVLGERAFVNDLVADGMLAGALLFSPEARALVVRIDTSRALAHPGVLAVLTAKDIPGERMTGLIYKDWPVMVGVGEETRCFGDVLASVAAVDAHTAREALGLIEVTLEPRPGTFDPEEALADDARRVNPYHDNLLSRTRLTRGDVEGALASSAHVVRHRFTTQRIEHAFLEPESCLVAPTRDAETGAEHFEVWSQGQGIFDDKKAIAEVLGVPAERVHVTLVPPGGAFGGKEDLSVQAHAALLARATGRPVKVTLSRHDSVRMHPKRHPFVMDYEVGCDADGHLTAVRARILGDSGAYASVGGKVLERAAGHACGPYRVSNIDLESRAAYTNNPPSGAMRGFGVCQTSFAIEGCIDELARRLGLDPLEMRLRNALRVGDVYSTGQVLEKSVGLVETLLAVKPHYEDARRRGVAVGVACGLKNSGLGNGAVESGRARIEVVREVHDGVNRANRSPGVIAYAGYTEMGQGLMTVLTQIVCEETGLPPERVRVVIDTTHPLGSGQTTGSRGTLLAGRAMKEAAQKLAAALRSGLELTALIGQRFDGEVIIDDTTAPGAPGPVKTHTTFGFATQMVELDAEGRVARVVAAHDVGRALNPDNCVGQVRGAVAMGLGYALTESLELEDGKPLTDKLRDLGPLRASDVPEIDVILVENHEPEGPYGAKGLGEIGLVPTAGAVAGALFAFDGVRRTSLPMRDSAAARAMSVGHHPRGHHRNHRAGGPP